MALWTSAAVYWISWIRDRASSRRAEWETGFAVTFIVTTGVYISATGLRLRAPLLLFPTTHARVAAVCLVVAATLFVLRGGTYVVRGLLDQSGALPKINTAEAPIDAAEYNRGRLIGNIERLLMLLAVTLGSYEVLGFLVAAKGLIRGKDLENRDFAEYFIIGNLASVLVALTVGVLLRRAVGVLWCL